MKFIQIKISSSKENKQNKYKFTKQNCFDGSLVRLLKA